MDTGEIVKNIGISHQKLYYLEQKDYIGPKKISITGGEFSNYSEEEVKKIKLIWKHLKQGMYQDVWSFTLWGAFSWNVWFRGGKLGWLSMPEGQRYLQATGFHK